MPEQSLEYKRHVLLPAQSGKHWTVLIRPPDQALVHPEFAKDDDYRKAILKARQIVDGICEKARALTAAERRTPMDPLTSVLQLHEQISAGLKQREQAVEGREVEARKILERTLASCAEERTSIGREKALLVEVEELYKRHANRDSREVPQTEWTRSASEQRPPLPPTVTKAILEPNDPMPLVASDVENVVAVTIRNLRQELISGMSAEKEKV